jgi:hypothetical protein
MLCAELAIPLDLAAQMASVIDCVRLTEVPPKGS